MNSYIWKILLGLAALYGVLVVATYVLQRKLLYFPDPRRTSPQSLGLAAVAEKLIETPDGQRIVAWYGAAEAGQPTILYFHGNAGALAGRGERIRKYLERGRGVFMMAYRGFGGSTGHPSEFANVADAKLAYDTLRAEGVAAKDIIVYGESLGSGVAVQVAAEKEVAGVVLDAPYTSIVDVAELVYPYLPARWLMTDRYETLRHLPRLTAPMLVLHGEADEIIPVAMGRKVAQIAGVQAGEGRLQPTRGLVTLITLSGAGHSDHHLFGSFEAINDWIDDVRGGRPTRQQKRPAE